MTVDHDLIRTALDHRIHAAGLHDDAAIPEPHVLSLDVARAAPRPGPTPARRLLAAAAALAVLGGAAAVVAARDGTSNAPSALAPAAPTSVAAGPRADGRPELPAPLPPLEVGPPVTFRSGAPITTPDDFEERLPELDAQVKAMQELTGRVNTLDGMTGEPISVDIGDLNEQLRVLLAWYREQAADGGLATTDGLMDPLPVFTDGSYRLVYRSDLDCSPLPDDRIRPACALLADD